MQFNKEQKAAIFSKAQYILCLAGAGTGKTAVLTNRIMETIKMGYSESSILAMTFTRASGKEMRERIEKVIGKKTNDIFINTFHALGVDLISSWGHKLGIESGFTIYDQEDVEQIIKNIIEDYKYKTKYKKIIEILNEKKQIESPEEKNIINEFHYILNKNNALTLSDLIDKMIFLLEEYPEIKYHYNNLYKFILVDEFQDTNMKQMRLIKLLMTSQTNLFVVGDDFQSIYGFRGAVPDYIIDFLEYFPKAEIIKLEQNYRCTDKIVAAANKIIKNNVNQTEKRLIANKKGEDILYLPVVDAEAEAEKIGSIIKSLKEKREDICILARTNKQCEFMHNMFKCYGIQSQVYIAKKEPLKDAYVKKILSIMEFALNTKDDFIFKRIINFPDKKLTNLKIKKMENIGIDEHKSLYELLPEDDKFKILIEKIKEMINVCFDAAQVFMHIYNKFNIDVILREQGIVNRLETMSEAHGEITSFSAQAIARGNFGGVEEFLRYLKLKDIHEKYIKKEEDKVKIMTCHASKGLEFPVVFIIGMNEGLFPLKKGDLEEERRLFYVAVTRAKDKLFVLNTEQVTLWGGKPTRVVPSRFIEEMK